MYQNKSILALIPARGGSKGVFRKNIKLLAEKPLIAWTIEQTQKSRYIDRIIVSTEDKEVADVCKKYNVEIPFMRPLELATDDAKMIDVIIHALDWTKNNSEFYDILILLQPTSPLRLFEDIDNAIELLFLKNVKAIVSVSEVDHPYSTNKLPSNGCMKDFIRPEVMDKNRQDLPQFYSINGAIYLAYTDYLQKQKGFFGNETFAYIMPKERSIDIDDETDFLFTEFLLQRAK